MDDPPSPDREITPEEALGLQEESREIGELLVWVVTWGTRDKGYRYTVRPNWITPGKVNILGVFMNADTLHELRAKLPPGLVRMDPAPEDDKVIVEVWI